MSSGQPPGLVLCGVDVVNPARTVTYIQNGFGPPGLTVGNSLGDGAFFGDDGAVMVYTDPASDPAPWYDPAVGESAEFLGFFPTGVTGYDGQPLTRQVDPRGGYIKGGSFNAEGRNPRQHDWTGVLIGSSCAGVEYGERWLSQVLAAACGDCALCDSATRLWSPDLSDDWEDGRWVEYEVGATAGPIVDLSGQLVCATTFTIVAGNPYLYKEPLAVVDGIPIAVAADAMGADCISFASWWCGAVATDVCVSVDPPVDGILSPIITFDATAGGTDAIHVLMYDHCPSGAPDPSSTPRGLRIASLPDGWILTIDSSRGVIDAVDPDGNLVNGANLVQSIDGGYPFLSVEDCSMTGCVCIGVDKPCAGNANTLVSVQVQRRSR